jgi:hypothetical protein
MADDMDRVLHAERLGPQRSKRTHPAGLSELPDGAMIAEDGSAWLVLGGELLHWSPFGYSTGRPRKGRRTVALLTPPSTLSAMKQGYLPDGLP